MADNVWLGTTTDWGLASNWSTGAIPTATDGNVVVFSGSSPNCSLGSSNKVCNYLMTTGYTNTLTFGVRSLSVSGDITLGTAHTFSVTTGGLVINATGSITTNGFVIPTNFQFGGASQTYTLQDDFVISPLALSFNATGTLAVNNNGSTKTIYAGGSVSTSAAGVQGTARLVLNGSGTINSTGPYRLDMDINTSGTYTIGTSFRYSEKTLTHIAGTVNPATSNFFVGQTGGATTVIDVSGITWYNVTTQASTTITLASDLYVSNQYTNTSSTSWNGNNIYIQGILSLGGSLSLDGTAKLKFIGSNCTWIGGTGILRLDSYIDTSGTFTLAPNGASNNQITGTGMLTYVSGNTITSGSTLDTLTAGATLDLDGMVLDNMNVRQGTVTLLSKLVGTGTLSLGQNSSCTFTGGFGWEFGRFTNVGTANKNFTLEAGVTYDVTTEMAMIGTSAVSSGTIRLLSSSASSDAFLNLNPTGSCVNRFCNPTDINSAGGRQITTVKGTLLRTTNWYVTNPDFYRFF